jgi:hypothetical protein
MAISGSSSPTKFDDKRMELVYEALTLASELARVPASHELGAWFLMLEDRAAKLVVSVSDFAREV